MDNITLTGLLAAICTTSAYLPQAIKIIRTKKTSDISLLMYSVMALGTFLWLLYGFFLHNFPLILANGIGFSLIATIFIMKIRYK
ncbi:MAG: SemiSWEET transporter [Bacteroidales bacterium]